MTSTTSIDDVFRPENNANLPKWEKRQAEYFYSEEQMELLRALSTRVWVKESNYYILTITTNHTGIFWARDIRSQAVKNNKNEANFP